MKSPSFFANLKQLKYSRTLRSFGSGLLSKSGHNPWIALAAAKSFVFSRLTDASAASAESDTGREATRSKPTRQMNTANWTVAASDITRMKDAINMFNHRQFLI